AGCKHSSFADAYRGMYRERHRLDTAHQNVFAPAVVSMKKWLNDELSRDQRTVHVVAGDSIPKANGAKCDRRQHARTVISGTLPQHDQIERITTGGERSLQARDEREEKTTGGDDQRDDADRHEATRRPAAEIFETVGKW